MIRRVCTSIERKQDSLIEVINQLIRITEMVNMYFNSETEKDDEGYGEVLIHLYYLLNKNRWILAKHQTEADLATWGDKNPEPKFKLMKRYEEMILKSLGVEND